MSVYERLLNFVEILLMLLSKHITRKLRTSRLLLFDVFQTFFSDFLNFSERIINYVDMFRLYKKSQLKTVIVICQSRTQPHIERYNIAKFTQSLPAVFTLAA